MPETNVNRLARNIENAQKLVENINTEIRRKYYSRHSASMSANGRKLVKQREEAIQKIMNMNSKLKTMNKNAIQVQLAKIENRRKNLKKNLNKATEGYGFGKRNIIENVFREYAHGPNNIKILENRIKGLPNATMYNKYKKAIAPIALKFARVRRNESALKKALALRKKHIGPEKPARNRFRSIVAQKVLPPIVQNINYVPYGRKTLNAMRRFPGYKEPSLENYARARREINRLQRELKRKRNNNNRN